MSLDAGKDRMIRGVATHLADGIEDNICPRIALEAIVRHEEAAKTTS